MIFYGSKWIQYRNSGLFALFKVGIVTAICTASTGSNGTDFAESPIPGNLWNVLNEQKWFNLNVDHCVISIYSLTATALSIPDGTHHQMR